MYVSCHRHFFLVLLLNQRWSPLLRLQASHCSTFRIMCDVPSIAVFCSESINCFPGIVSKFFFKLLVTIPVAPIITGTSVHLRFHIRCISIHILLYFNFFSAPFCTRFIIIIIITTFILRNTFGQKDSWRGPTTIASGTLRDAVHRLYQDVLYVQTAVRFLRHTPRCNLIYACKKRAAFPASSFPETDKRIHGIVCRFVIPNCTQMGQLLSEIAIEFH